VRNVTHNEKKEKCILVAGGITWNKKKLWKPTHRWKD